MNFNSYLASSTKTNLKWILDLNVKTVKLLEKTCLCPWVKQRFLRHKWTYLWNRNKSHGCKTNLWLAGRLGGSKLGDWDWHIYAAMYKMGFPGGSVVKNPPTMQETWQEPWVWFLGQEDPLEKETATHSNTLPWKVPWTARGISKELDMT